MAMGWAAGTRACAAPGVKVVGTLACRPRLGEFSIILRSVLPRACRLCGRTKHYAMQQKTHLMLSWIGLYIWLPGRTCGGLTACAQAVALELVGLALQCCKWGMIAQIQTRRRC